MSDLFASPLVETIIGLVVVWFLAATLSSGIVEVVGAVLGFRAKHLWRALARALGTSAPKPEVAIREAARLAMGPKIEESVFKGFIDKLPGVAEGELSRVKHIGRPAAAEALVAARVADEHKFAGTQLGKLVDGLPHDIKTNTGLLRDWLEKWFDGEMERLGATYRSRIRWWVAVAGALVVVVCGIDSIGLADRLYDQPTRRQVLLSEAGSLVDAQGAGGTSPSGTTGGELSDEAMGNGAPTAAAPSEPAGDPADEPDGEEDPCEGNSVEDKIACAQRRAAELSALHVAWWDTPEDDRGPTWRIVLGSLLTFAAVSAGAPFWFDVLSRMTGLRGRAAASRS